MKGPENKENQGFRGPHPAHPSGNRISGFGGGVRSPESLIPDPESRIQKTSPRPKFWKFDFQ